MCLKTSSIAASTPPLPDTTTRPRKRLTIETISSNLKSMEYAVRGKIAIEADKITEELKHPSDASKNYPFDHIIYTNIGNPHAVQQKALTWPRQVMALLQLPDAIGINHPEAHRLFPEDAIARAKEMKSALGGSGIGAYTHSKGVKEFREDVARFIEKRDGAREGSVDVENIFLTAGASEAITMVMTALIKDSSW
jgi:aspartate/methionine/tyrosine aminotransferase